MDRGVWTAKTVKRPRQQPAHPQYATYWAPLTRKRHTMPHSAQSQHANYWAQRTRKQHQQEHRPQRPTESSDPTQQAKGRTGDRPGPRKGATTRRNVTRGGGRSGKGAQTAPLPHNPPSPSTPPHKSWGPPQKLPTLVVGATICSLVLLALLCGKALSCRAFVPPHLFVHPPQDLYRSPARGDPVTQMLANQPLSLYLSCCSRGGAYWPIAIRCPSLEPFPSIAGGAHRPLTTLCPSSSFSPYLSLSTSLPFMFLEMNVHLFMSVEKRPHKNCSQQREKSTAQELLCRELRLLLPGVSQIPLSKLRRL